ncbi:MAG: DUF4912 domain-containing protein [Proteobacteria bacterium]|nr:DUF4912 domain-containing protein [Pseudomonadota bacterium]MBU1717164.1 DUF4912 domain-containing protein [Pseudomonadota bacterium]
MEKNCDKNERALSGRSSDILPGKYGVTSVVLLPVEPGKVHVYWDFVLRQASSFGNDSCLKTSAGDDPHRTKTILRFYEVVAGGFDRHFDLEVDAYAGSRYVEVPRPGGVYVVEFGFRAATGHFFPAMRSDVVQTPPPAPAEVAEVVLPAGSELLSEVESGEGGSGDFAVESGTRSGIVTRKRQAVNASQSGMLSAVSASANIKFLSVAREKGCSREEIRTEMDRFWQLTLQPDHYSTTSLKLSPVDLTELCENRFLFGNSSK